MFHSYKDSVIDGDGKSNSRVSASFEVSWATIYDTTQENINNVEELGEIHDSMNSFSINEILDKLVGHGAKHMEYRNLVTY